MPFALAPRDVARTYIIPSSYRAERVLAQQAYAANSSKFVRSDMARCVHLHSTMVTFRRRRNQRCARAIVVTFEILRQRPCRPATGNLLGMQWLAEVKTLLVPAKVTLVLSSSAQEPLAIEQ